VDRKSKVVLEGADRFVLSRDGSKLLYRAEDDGPMGIIDAKLHRDEDDVKTVDGPHKVGDDSLKLDGMRAEVDPPQEWKEMFNEVFRQERDYFFEPSMNGVDWPKVRDKYAQLLPYVSDRYSLTYILGQMIAELR
jgi:tricorn protease